MASRQLLKLLKHRSGINVWNAWRKEHPDTDRWNAWRKEHPDRFIDLSGANLNRAFLIKADLSGANLSRADIRSGILYDANLSQADLNHANLIQANLGGANLSGADLGGADLREADFTGANLTGANLSGASLGRVFLSNANLSGANLSHADIGYTTFGNIDLRNVTGLETINHRFPSIVGIDTILRSEGNIPALFLRGTGATDAIINYVRSLAQRPTEYYTCFISYSSQDEEFARLLYVDLQDNGVRCWFATEDLKIGDHYHQHIEESIRLYDKLILVLSEHAVQSAWVEREVVAAREKEDHEQRPVLFPLRLDDAVMHTTKAWAADVRRRWHIGDFTRWKGHDTYQQAFERLLRDLKAERKPAT